MKLAIYRGFIVVEHHAPELSENINSVSLLVGVHQIEFSDENIHNPFRPILWNDKLISVIQIVERYFIFLRKISKKIQAFSFQKISENNLPSIEEWQRNVAHLSL